MIRIQVSGLVSGLPRAIQACLSRCEPVCLVGDAGEELVLLSKKEYEAHQETLYVLSNEHLRQQIRTALSHPERRRVMSDEEAENAGF